jgi:hypothetical protein
MTQLEKRKLERVRYWQGQMLRSRDFRDLEAVEAQRRWWHNRALHHAYGISEGLQSSLAPSASATPTAVEVCPGVAYDAFGHELILERRQTIPLPPNLAPSFTGSVTLLLRYKPPAGTLPPDEISEVCWTQRGSIRPGTIELAWKLTSCLRLRPEDGVPVFALVYSASSPTISEDQKFIPTATRPIASPTLATGSTVPGNTAWEPWMFEEVTLGVQTWIDTSAAGFSRVPCYFAWLEGSLWNAQTLQLIPAIFPSITDESVTGFTFRLWLEVAFPQSTDPNIRGPARSLSSRTGGPPFNFVVDPGDFSLLAQQQDLYVTWIACQMTATPVSCCSMNPAASAMQTSTGSPSS